MTTSGLLGQTSFTTATSGHSSTTMNGPSGLKYDAVNSRLFVGDYTNSRVLVFNVAPGFTKGEAASYVLGQTSFTGHAAGCSQTALSGLGPSGYDPNNNLLYVSAFGNARVLVFNVPLSVTNGTSYGENAIFELGQTSGPSAFSICNPPSLQLRPANRLKIALGVSDACWVYPWWSVLTQEVVRRNT